MWRAFESRPQDGIAHFHAHWQPLPEFPALGYISEGICLGSHTLKPHTHPVFEICYIHGGKGEWFAEGQTYKLQPGDLYITRPGEIHGGHTDPNDPYHIFAMHIDIPALPNVQYVRSDTGAPKELPAPAPSPQPFSDVTLAVHDAQSLHDEFLALNQRVVPGGAGLEHTFRKILRELDTPKTDPRGRALKLMMLQALLVELLVFVARAYAQHGQTCLATALPPQSDDRVFDLLRFISLRLANPPTLQELAERIDLSPAYVTVLFKQHTGMTPLEYITTVRVTEAARRLRNSRASVTDIALDLGFVTPQYFSLVFKKQKGCTPSAWREGRSGK